MKSGQWERTVVARLLTDLPQRICFQNSVNVSFILAKELKFTLICFLNYYLQSSLCETLSYSLSNISLIVGESMRHKLTKTVLFQHQQGMLFIVGGTGHQ